MTRYKCFRSKRAPLFSHCVLPLDPRQWSFFSVDSNFESEAILTTWLLSSVAVVCQDWITRSVINMSCLKRSNALGSRYNCYACSCTSMCTTYTLLEHSNFVESAFVQCVMKWYVKEWHGDTHMKQELWLLRYSTQWGTCTTVVLLLRLFQSQYIVLSSI